MSKSQPVSLDQYPCLELRPQVGPHDEASVLGNRAGLVALARAINKALMGEACSEEVFASDGEGYPISVRMVGPMHDSSWDGTGSPYVGYRVLTDDEVGIR